MTVRKLLLLLLIGLTGCSVVAGQIGIPWTSSIAQIRSRPPLNRSVYLEGTVVQIVPLVNQQIYQLQDDSSEIWVLTQTPIQPNDAVKIRGVVRFESIQIDGQEQGEIYIEERDRL